MLRTAAILAIYQVINLSPSDDSISISASPMIGRVLRVCEMLPAMNWKVVVAVIMTLSFGGYLAGESRRIDALEKRVGELDAVVQKLTSTTAPLH